MMMRRRLAAALAAAVLAVLPLGGCVHDAICGSGAYPVLQIGGTGRQCVDQGDEPPAGFTRFPAGQEPRHVDDDWDVFWRAHTVDAQGRTVEVPR